MPSSWSRRAILHATGAALGSTAISGCLFGVADSPGAGTFVIRNDHPEDHTVTVHVS